MRLLMILSTLYVGIVRFFGDAFIFDYTAVELTAIVDGATLGLVIDSDKAEASRLSLSPLEVIKEAPVVVSLDGVLGLGYKLQLIVDEERTEGIVVIAGAVLGDEYGRAILRVKLVCKLDESLVVYLPAEIVYKAILSHAVGESGNGATRVVVDADEIVVLATLYSLALEHGEYALARHHSLSDSTLEEPLGCAGAESMPEIVLILRCKSLANHSQISSYSPLFKTRIRSSIVRSLSLVIIPAYLRTSTECASAPEVKISSG